MLPLAFPAIVPQCPLGWWQEHEHQCLQSPALPASGLQSWEVALATTSSSPFLPCSLLAAQKKTELLSVYKRLLELSHFPLHEFHKANLFHSSKRKGSWSGVNTEHYF